MERTGEYTRTAQDGPREHRPPAPTPAAPPEDAPAPHTPGASTAPDREPLPAGAAGSDGAGSDGAGSDGAQPDAAGADAAALDAADATAAESDADAPDSAGSDGAGAAGTDGAESDAAGADAAGSGAAADGAAPAPATAPEALDRPLPEGVRRRVIGLAAEAFGTFSYAELPAQLRQYARFTPARRARFAATALAAALEGDDAFRRRMAARLRQAQPELADALDAGTVPAAADPLDVAAAAYLLRPAGWTKLVAAAGDEAERERTERANEEVVRELAQVKEELAALRTSARADADKARAELDAARKEVEALNRRLRSAVNDVRRGEAELRKVQAELDAVRGAAATERTAAESEARRLRSRLAEAESALEASRRAVREGRSVEDMRLRLLLDTVLDAAQGLRRELALPPTTGRPADTVEAVTPGRMTPKDIARRALSEDDPALLDQLLALPQAHLVVDGYNVTKTGYPTMPLEKQRLRLLGGLAGLAAQSGAEVTCVFDGADLEAPVLLAPPRGVRVLFSKSGETADELIRRLVRAEPPGRPVVVVSADREVADGVRRAGARPVASTLLLKRLARG